MPFCDGEEKSTLFLLPFVAAKRRKKLTAAASATRIAAGFALGLWI
jgi:hypothetical protein